VTLETGTIALVPVRAGVRPVALVALGGRPIDPGSADAIAGIVAIAIERARFLEEQQAAEFARHRADLTSVLIAALGHDLRTPLTTIRVAVTNAADGGLDPALRAEQARLALDQIDHLGRLLQEILDLARIEAHAVHAERAWVTAGAVVEAAIAHAGTALARHRLAVEADESQQLELDPRLTASALAHVLENAAKYSPAGSRIAVEAGATAEGLQVTVGDEGPGLKVDDLERLFEPFYRGRSDRHAVGGTGLGLAITRGLLAAEGGRIWADAPGGPGARFTIVVPARVRSIQAEGART
jgi:two-component system sensor histidine kinase KdpD